MLNLIDPSNRRLEISDTVRYGGIDFIIPQGFPVSASAIRNATFIFPDSLFRVSNVNRTYQHLNGLRNFQLITQEFTEIPDQTGLLERELDCVINLLPLFQQSYSLEFEGTYSERNLGGGARLTYHNRSLFGNAEFFNLRLRGFFETVPNQRRFFDFRSKLEYEAEASLNIPKFLLPIRSGLSNRFTQNYNPSTTISMSYSYQQYPEYYVRTVFNTSFGYNWRGSVVNSHLVKPIDIIFVRLPEDYLRPDFLERLERFPSLRNSFRSHMIVSSNYTFVRDMRLMTPRRTNSFFTRFNIESAGLLLNAAYRISDQPKDSRGSYQMFGNNFSQFIKGDIDLRYYYTINGNNRMVFRTFAGMGIPYGNSKITIANADGETFNTTTIAAMPYEKKFHSGGANSMRGWRLRSLGPGSYEDELFTDYPNSTGDIKLEANLEYRFNLVWKMEGALFMDAGNVWDSRKDSDRPGANFSFDRFYREIALSGGLGLRFDFDFFIIRADLGMKMYNPVGNGRWVFNSTTNVRRLRDEFCLNIAIGYPFF
jgi:outer membrane protein assembly factor BamA